jgi:ATP-binding cassette subfamily B protein
MTPPPVTRRSLLMRYGWRERGRLSVIAVLMVLAAAMAALQPLPLKLLVDYGLHRQTLPGWVQQALGATGLSGGAQEWVLAAALLSFVVFLLNAGVDATLAWCWSVIGHRMVFGLTTQLFQKVVSLTPLFHNRTPIGDSISRLTGDTWCVYTFVSGFVMGPVQRVATLFSVGVVAFWLDRQLAWVAVGMAPFLAGSSWYFGRRLKARAKQGQRAQAGLLSFVQQTLSSLPAVQAFATEPRNRDRFGLLAEDAISIAKRGAILSSSFGLVNGVITTVGTASILFFGGLRVLNGSMSLGTLLVFMAYMQTLQASLEALLKLYGSFKPLEASIDRVLDLLNAADVVADPPAAAPLPPVEIGRTGSVQFEDVTFGYSPGQPVLEAVTLAAAPGERVALVGHSGAGKSTLISLLPRLLEPWSGRITLDGRDIRTIRLADLRARISVLLQEPYLLPVSVAANIAFGRPSASREAVVDSARAAGAHEFIEALPNGYDTVLAERGSTLSGGERQRIAIARAFLRDSPILVLDEPTSALDAATEQGVLQALDRLAQGRTTLIIAHRLSTVRRATRIVVLERGRIIESGSHEALLAARGAYARYCQAQFGASAGVPA